MHYEFAHAKVYSSTVDHNTSMLAVVPDMQWWSWYSGGHHYCVHQFQTEMLDSQYPQWQFFYELCAYPCVWHCVLVSSHTAQEISQFHGDPDQHIMKLLKMEEDPVANLLCMRVWGMGERWGRPTINRWINCVRMSACVWGEKVDQCSVYVSYNCDVRIYVHYDWRQVV